MHSGQELPHLNDDNWELLNTRMSLRTEWCAEAMTSCIIKVGEVASGEYNLPVISRKPGHASPDDIENMNSLARLSHYETYGNLDPPKFSSRCFHLNDDFLR